MLTSSAPVTGAVLLALALLVSSVAAWSLWRMRARTRRAAGPAAGPGAGRTPGGPLLGLGVAAVCAATGAAALSDGTVTVGGWLPFVAGLAVSTLPLAVVGALSRRSG